MNDQIEQLINDYRALNLQDVLHYEKFNQYAITHHSTALEGNKLTVKKRLLFKDLYQRCAWVKFDTC